MSFDNIRINNPTNYFSHRVTPKEKRRKILKILVFHAFTYLIQRIGRYLAPIKRQNILGYVIHS